MRGLLTVLCLALALPASARSHVVAPAEVEARVLAAEAARARDLATVNDALSSPEVAWVAREAGIDVERLRGAIPALTSDELEDLAARARALELDPAAGAGKMTYLLVGAALLLVIIVIAASGGGSGGY
jgi:hypothetical protein